MRGIIVWVVHPSHDLERHADECAHLVVRNASDECFLTCKGDRQLNILTSSSLQRELTNDSNLMHHL